MEGAGDMVTTPPIMSTSTPHCPLPESDHRSEHRVKLSWHKLYFSLRVQKEFLVKQKPEKKVDVFIKLYNFICIC